MSHILVDDHHDHGEITVTVSDDEQQLNDSETECELCDLKINTFTVASITNMQTLVLTDIASLFDYFYFFKNDQKTSFLLRGPPSKI
ncbi:hypothetical protein BTO06_08285 [Tenacibaculum sp. SZ-18]|uniref:hypothetical protein n=1 Tax=Tenacibaculum sp. SZ-18 TaxID=754423 RepID=UPI000C2D3FC4|nr:hypothetical protein [Tenacibaculum sp. SZ-18]AUC15134.1 hypothetical protein BTO06_08285 [Tenacibaculum sp. SZ-18]